LVEGLPKIGESTPEPWIPKNLGVKPPKPLTGLGVKSLKNIVKKKTPGWFRSQSFKADQGLGVNEPKDPQQQPGGFLPAAESTLLTVRSVSLDDQECSVHLDG
jgi:hypothetical protein